MVIKRVVYLIIVMSLVMSPYAASEISGDYRETGTIPEDDYVVYHLNMTKPGMVLDVTVTTNKRVDFYLLTPSEYNDYIDPSSLSFGFEVSDENSQEFHWRGSGNYYLVIDNMNLTTTGAESTGPVNYTITVNLESETIKDRVMDNIGYMICGSLIFIAIATTAWLYKKPKLEGVLKK